MPSETPSTRPPSDSEPSTTTSSRGTLESLPVELLGLIFDCLGDTTGNPAFIRSLRFLSSSFKSVAHDAAEKLHRDMMAQPKMLSERDMLDNETDLQRLDWETKKSESPYEGLRVLYADKLSDHPASSGILDVLSTYRYVGMEMTAVQENSKMGSVKGIIEMLPFVSELRPTLFHPNTRIIFTSTGAGAEVENDFALFGLVLGVKLYRKEENTAVTRVESAVISIQSEANGLQPGQQIQFWGFAELPTPQDEGIMATESSEPAST